MITKSITYINEFGCGFEATVGLNSHESRVDLDLNYISGCSVSEDDSFGICLTAEGAEGLAQFLYHFADKLRESEAKRRG